MSAPVSHNDNKNADDPSFYAPRGGRRSSLTAPASDFTAAVPSPVADARIAVPAASDTAPERRERPALSERPRMAPGTGGPNLECPPSLTERVANLERTPLSAPVAPPRDPERTPSTQPPGFAGDVAIRALRHRLAHDPDIVPEPPVLAELRPRHTLSTIMRPVVFVAGAAVVAFCVTVLTLPSAPSIPLKRDNLGELKSLISTASGPLLKTARLVVEERQAAFANEPLQLGISLTGAIGGEFALMTGLATGTRFSTGAPVGENGWKLPARDLLRTVAVAPQDFVGVMHAAVDLRAGNNALVDRQITQLQWVPKQNETWRQPRPDREEITPVSLQGLNSSELANLVRRGQDYLKNGDLAAARLVLRRAVGADDPQAALALGATFDPLVFGELGVLGFQPDTAQARIWYERAVQLGSNEAQHRIDRLARGR